MFYEVSVGLRYGAYTIVTLGVFIPTLLFIMA